MTGRFARNLDQLVLPAPVVVGMVLVVALFAKGGHSLWSIGGMAVFYVLFIVVRLIKQRVFIERATTTSRPILSLVLTGPVKSSSQASPVLPRDREPLPHGRAPLREAA